MTRILVTGGTGVVGLALQSNQTNYPGCEFVFASSRDCDLRRPDETTDFFRRKAVKAVIHLAAISGGIGISMKYPASILRDNVLMNLNVLEAARICKLDKVIMTLSSGMYPARASLPLTEEQIHDGYPHESNYSYSFAKRLVDPALKAYRTEYGLNAIGLIPNGIFGEGDNFNYDDAPMLPALIRRFFENRHGASEIIIWGDGSPLREYTYAKDVARAYMWCYSHYDDSAVLNIGSVEEYSIKDIAYAIAEIMGIDKARIKFDLKKPKGIFRKNTDNSKFIKISRFQYTPFRTALENTISWYIDTAEHHPECIKTGAKMRRAT